MLNSVATGLILAPCTLNPEPFSYTPLAFVCHTSCNAALVSCRLIFQLLFEIEIIIKTFVTGQFLVRALLDDLTVSKNKNQIGMHD